MRIANKDAGRFVNNCISFKGNNIFGEINPLGVYVVYSYGYHFPMYAKVNGKWYGNKDKYSVSTSKHQSQTSPSEEITYLSTDELKNVIDKGCL